MTLTSHYQRPDADAAAAYLDGRAPASAPLVDFPGPHAIRNLPAARPPRLHGCGVRGRRVGRRGARPDSQIVYTFPRVGDLSRGLRPPADYVRRYRLVSVRTLPGHPL
jgi:hypothetical protein